MKRPMTVKREVATFVEQSFYAGEGRCALGTQPAGRRTDDASHAARRTKNAGDGRGPLGTRLMGRRPGDVSHTADD